MAKRSTPVISYGSSSSKRRSPTTNGTEPPRKKVKSLMADESSSSSDAESSGGAPIGSAVASTIFTVNEDFARKFEHNKKREELQRRVWTFPYLLNG